MQPSEFPRDLKVAEIYEPFTERAHESTPAMAESLASELLGRELNRYVDGKVPGLSVLVAGHRGAGKTTLVRSAIEAAYNRSRAEQAWSRPLLVPLHGPDLMPDPRRPYSITEDESTLVRPQAPAAAAATPAGGGAGKAGEAEPRKDDGPGSGPDDLEPENASTQRVLVRITIALYRALAREMALAYGDHLHRAALRNRAVRPDWAELAGRLELELDDAPDPSLLRDFWNKARVMESGVLFPLTREGQELRAGQGTRELVALSTAAQAYRVVSGVYDQTRSLRESDDLERTRRTETGGKAADLLTAGMGLLTGSAAGAGVLLGGVSTGIGAALATLLAGVAATWVVKYSTVRTQKRTLTSEYTFIRSRSISTLDRELPVLLDRIRAAGLAPVFVVDELDKVFDLPDRMGALIQHLKHFVTERAFFLFLADRYYFEFVDASSEVNPYPRAHTYFTHRLFVLYRPEELLEYVRRLLGVAATYLSIEDLERVEADREALAHVLLFNARLHPFDLRRQLASIADTEGYVRLSRGAVRTQLGYRYHLAMQLAIEHLLRREELRYRLDRDPYFGQIAYDTLYYPARVWERGNTELDVSLSALEKHLLDRVRKNREGLSAHRNGNGGDPVASPATIQEVLSRSDLEFLHRYLLELVRLLTHPNELVRELTDYFASEDYPAQVLQAVPRRKAGLPDPRLLEPVPASAEQYYWRFDTYGRVLRGAKVRDVSDQDIRTEQQFIRDMETFVRDLTWQELGLGALAVQVGLLDATPDWSSVAAALDLLDSNREGAGAADDARLQDARVAVDEYAQMLETRGHRLAQGILKAREAGSLAPGVGGAIPTEGQQLAAGLRALGAVLRLRADPDPARVDARLLQTGPDLVPRDFPGLRIATAEEWRTRVRDLLPPPLPPPDPAGVLRDAWAEWQARFDQFLATGSGSFDPVDADLLCHAAGARFASLLQLDLRRMTLADWSEAALLALSPGPDPFGSVPHWLLVPALVQLGFGPALSPGSFDPAVRGGATARAWLGQYGTSPAWQGVRPAALILRSPAQPIPSRPPVTEKWLPATSYAALVVEVPSLAVASALHQLLEMIRSRVPISVVMYDGALPADPVVESIVQQLELDRSAQFVLGDEVAPGGPPLVSLGRPKDLEEAMSRAMRLLPAAAPARAAPPPQ